MMSRICSTAWKKYYPGDHILLFFLVENPNEALELVKNKKFDLILTDLKMEDISGIDILKAALNKFSDATVIMMSGYGTIEASVEAMREGAFDFIEKPFTAEKLFETINRAFRHLSASGRDFSEDDADATAFSGIIYQSNEIANILNIVRKVAPGNMNILITGESGTGKELIARAIHNLSRRRHNPFVPVNCGALPENLFESELFGHEKGAFTGAVKTKPGLLEFANQGTFFLDEIGDMSLQLQVKLLRMLEERKIRRVGGQSELDIDVRIITATNKNVEKDVAEKKFREDLYYRLNTIKIEIPPLRERTADIMPLANHMLSMLSSRNERLINKFSSDAEKALLSYPWAGNVRELQNMIERAYFLCNDQIIQRSDLPIPMQEQSIMIDHNVINQTYKNAKDAFLESFEVEYLTHHLKKYDGNISKTAEYCGLDRRTIHRLIKKYNIDGLK